MKEKKTNKNPKIKTNPELKIKCIYNNDGADVRDILKKSVLLFIEGEKTI